MLQSWSEALRGAAAIPVTVMTLESAFGAWSLHLVLGLFSGAVGNGVNHALEICIFFLLCLIETMGSFYSGQ